jgi:hypothetical protein
MISGLVIYHLTHERKYSLNGIKIDGMIYSIHLEPMHYFPMAIL